MTRNLIYILLMLGFASCRPVYFSETVKYISDEQNHAKVVRLDLSHQNLKSLPDDFEQYENLKFLNLSNNPDLQLDNIGNQLVNLKKLKVLQLDSNNLLELPKWVGQLKSIKNISLVYNPQLNYSKSLNNLNTLKGLKKLNLSYNNLLELPESITGLTQLKNLRLSHNKINDSNSFKRLARLENLKFLWLDNNLIVTLDPEIGALSQVSELYLDNNQLGFLPKEIASCKKLHILYLGNNRFKELPDEILSMNIYMLAIYGNEISTIPVTYQKMRTPMKIILLDNNRLDIEQQKIAKKSFIGFFVMSIKNQK